MEVDGYYDFQGIQLYRSRFDLSWVEKYAPDLDPKIIFEFGSYDGGDGVRFKQKYQTAKVFSIEACPILFSQIVTMNELHRAGLEIHHLAISDIDGVVSFYQCIDTNRGPDQFGGAGSILERTQLHLDEFPHLSYPKPVDVQAKRLDTFCGEHGIESIDILHVDVEGAEMKVLLGLGTIRPKMIFLEKHLGKDWYGPNAYDYAEMNNYLISNGYKLVEEYITDNLYVLI